MFEMILQIIIALGIWAIFWSIQTGINEIIKGLESLDEKMAKFEKN